MNINTTLKNVLRPIGLYPHARACYRAISPKARADRESAIRFYGDLIAPGDLCFDIGANVGQTSEALLANGAVVVAVEPNMLCRPVLEWQFKRDGRFTLVSKAMGAEPGVANLHFSGTQSTASFRDDWISTNRDSQTVEVTTIDALIAEFGRPKLCKVDVEGHELQVFHGLSEPIPMIYFEARQSEATRAREVLARLADVGEITGVNMTDMLHQGWLFERFLPLEEFLAQFDRQLYGVRNILVNMACPSAAG